MPEQFKVGDRVRLVRWEFVADCPGVGRIGTIVAIENRKRWPVRVKFDAYDMTVPCSPDELEKLPQPELSENFG